MSKVKKFVGQPILTQVLSSLPKKIVRDAVAKHSSDRYYKRIPVKVHLATLLFKQFNYET